MLVAHALIELAQQEVESHLLCAAEPLDGLGKIGDCLAVAFVLDVVVGKGQVGERASLAVLNLVNVDVCQDVVGLGSPAHGAVTECFPNLRFLHQVGLPREVARNVVEGGRRTQEVAFHVLGLGEHVPRIVQEGVILVALEPLLVLGVIALAGFLLGFLLDGVQGNGLLHLLDGAVKAAAALGRLGVGL